MAGVDAHAAIPRGHQRCCPRGSSHPACPSGSSRTFPHQISLVFRLVVLTLKGVSVSLSRRAFVQAGVLSSAAPAFFHRSAAAADAIRVGMLSGHRFAVMEKGRVVAGGATDELTNDLVHRHMAV